MEINEIKEYLPHRYPFLFVDRVLELIPGEKIIAYKNVSANEDVFNGHFPHLPIFPGVLIIEALAQASGILGFATVNKRPDEKNIYLFAGVDGVRFKRQVIPGDCLKLESSIDSVKRNIWRFSCRATVDDKLACEARLLCALQELD